MSLLRKGLILLALGLLVLLGGLLYFPPWRDAVTQSRWYLTDETPPQVSIAVPTETVRGVITASVAVRDEGPYVLDSLHLDNQPLSVTIPLSIPLSIDTAALSDGDHVLLAEASDLSSRRNMGWASAAFRTENTPPSVVVRLEPPQAAQGHTLLIRLGLSKPATVTASYDGKPLPIVGQDGILPNGVQFCPAASCWAILGFAPDAKLITHTLAFGAVDHLGNASLMTTTFGVTATAWIVEDIVLPPDRVGLSNTATEDQHLAAALAAFSRTPLWQGPFQVPAPGEITAPFGEARSYNGGPVASFHAGVDLAAQANGPVAAAAAGRVVLAAKLPVQGNAVLLDHGLGLVSAYYHLSAIQVKPGDMVRQGQTVGLVGNTGLSTGPHLHWEIRLLGAPVDPWEWTWRAIPGL